VRKPLKSGPVDFCPGRHETGRYNGTKGRRRREAWPATEEGKPLKVETQGRFRHETRLGRSRAEQDVKRLRKPVGVAQPGQVSPVWVAARFRMRRRVRNLKEDGRYPCGPGWIQPGEEPDGQDSQKATSRDIWRTAPQRIRRRTRRCVCVGLRTCASAGGGRRSAASFRSRLCEPRCGLGCL
jgi:hypothetical protein